MKYVKIIEGYKIAYTIDDEDFCYLNSYITDIINELKNSKEDLSNMQNFCNIMFEDKDVNYSLPTNENLKYGWHFWMESELGGYESLSITKIN